MKTILRRIPLIALSFGVVTLVGWQVSAETNRVTFPENLDQLLHYTTVKRRNVTEHILTSRAAIDAVKNGQSIPNGTHFVLVDYRDGEVYRYFVMEKGAGWGTDYETRRRTADWQFQWFNPDKTINMNENTARCQSCHQARAESEHLFTFNDIREFR